MKKAPMDSRVILKIIRRREIRRKGFNDKPFESSSVGDLAFLLLIFFIVTSSFILRQGIFFSLPSKKASTIRLEQEQIIEVYPKNEGVLYNGKLIDRNTFKKRLLTGLNAIKRVL